MRLIAVILVLLLGITGFSLGDIPPNQEPITAHASAVESLLSGFTEWNTVSAIFENKCVSCHGPDEADRGLRLDSWEYVFEGSDFGEAVVAYDADNSLLFELLTKYRSGSHPAELDSQALTEAEVETIRSWIDSGAPSAEGAIPYDDDGPRLYVANQGSATVSVIDMRTNQVVRTVDLQELGFTMGAMPHHVAVEADGSYWYVSLIVDNKILKFSRDNELVGEADVERPGLVSLDPSGPWLYAARSMMSVSPPESMVQIDRRDMSVEVYEVLMPRPHALATSLDGRSVYVSSLGMNRVATFNSESGDMVFDDVYGDAPHVFIGFAISPDGTTMVGTSEVSSKAFVFDLTESDGVVLKDTVSVGRAPWHPIYSADGNHVLFGNNWTNQITVLDMRTLEVAKVIEGAGLAQPHGSASSPDGKFMYVSNRNLAMPEGHSKEHHVYRPRYDFGDNRNAGTVLVIDTASWEIVKIIEVEKYASGMGTAAVAP